MKWSLSLCFHAINNSNSERNIDKMVISVQILIDASFSSISTYLFVELCEEKNNCRRIDGIESLVVNETLVNIDKFCRIC